MTSTIFEPMARYSQVHATKDYDLFKILKGNRKVNQLHVKRLASSFKSHYLFSPILVNEKWQIIDGQHRYLAAKELGLPIYYIVISGYGLNEAHILNVNTSNWKKEDFLTSYCDLGLVPYLQMRQFMLDFPELGFQAAEYLLTDNVSGANSRRDIPFTGGRHRAKSFQEGEFTIPDLAKSYDNAEKVMMFKPYYDGFNRGIFVCSLLTIFRNENYNHAEMISKLAQQPTALTHCTSTIQYKMLIEEIYNFRRREKVNLRY